MFLAACLLAGLIAMTAPKTEAPYLRAELIAKPESLHNHGSCIVETPKGNLLVCWYRGSGERTADDVAVVGARLQKGRKNWSPMFVMHDTPGYPDTNPCMIVDPQSRLWLFWGTVLDNHWETALTKYKISAKFEQSDSAPVWEQEKILHLKPGEEFQRIVERDLDKQWLPYAPSIKPDQKEKFETALKNLHEWAKVKLYTRLGWMTRAHPTFLASGRMIVPLYSDRFDFSLMAITDDGGATWRVSEPLVGAGNVQPSIAIRKDGTLLAYFRDNGMAPQRVQVSESKDEGMTWTLAKDTEMFNPGAGLEVLVLKSGRWVLINNDTEDGRHRLALHVSEDEGKTWRTARYLEKDDAKQGGGSYSYPSIIQTRNGRIHATYSYTPNTQNALKEGKGETIKHAEFNETWLLEGRGNL